EIARALLAAHRDQAAIVSRVDDADGALLQGVADALKSEFGGPIFLGSASDTRVDLIAAIPKTLTNKFHAGQLIQESAPMVGGKGGGRPEMARGTGRDPSQFPAALEKARELFQEQLGQVPGR